MSRLFACDFPGCERRAAYRIMAVPVAELGEPILLQSGVDTCEEHYEITHPGKGGGGWWDDAPAPQLLYRGRNR